MPPTTSQIAKAVTASATRAIMPLIEDLQKKNKEIEDRMNIYPARMGKKWETEEVDRLLASIQIRKSITAIAEEHQRTIGSINSERRKLATKYWFNDRKSVEEISKLTGLSSTQIEDAVKRRIGCNIPIKTEQDQYPVNKMEFRETFSREKLQSIPAQRRLEAIRYYIDTHIYGNVYNTASAGKTSYFYKLENVKSMGSSYPPSYQVTNEDLVEGLRIKFPDCTVNYIEDWIEVRPGVRQQQKGISIDWS